jgi:hypothetical protein
VIKLPELTKNKALIGAKSREDALSDSNRPSIRVESSPKSLSDPKPKAAQAANPEKLFPFNDPSDPIIRHLDKNGDVWTNPNTGEMER